MKKQIFSLGVYRESMRRLLRAGCVFGVILLLGTVLFPLTIHAARQQQIYSQTEVLPFPFMILLPTVVAPVLAWIAFSFLRHRNTSDFFHALPQTRLSLFCSVSAALCTWLLLLTAVPLAAGYLTVSFFPHFSLSFHDILLYGLQQWIAALQIAAMIVFAQSITGTFFSSLIVGGMILFAPHVVLYSVTQTLDDVLHVTMFAKIGIFSPECNFGLMSYIQLFLSSLSFFFGGAYDPQSNLLPYLFSVGLAILFFVLSGVCFCRRRSETAEHSAPNRKIQALLRVLVFCAISLPITPLLFSGIYRRPNFAEAWGYLIFYGVAAVAYFAYELITTKRFRNLLRAIPGFAVGIALNAALLGILYGVSEKVLSFTPQQAEIQSVTLLSGIGGEAFDDYAIAKTGPIEITDAQLCDLFAAKLCAEVEEVKKEREQKEHSLSETQTYSVLIRTKTGRYLRQIPLLQQKEKDRIIEVYASHERFSTAYLNLPMAEEVKEITLCMGEEEFTRLGAEDVYQTLRDEVKALSLSEWDQLRTEWAETGEGGTLRCTTWFGGKRYELEFPVSAVKTPKTFEKLAKIVYERNELISDAFWSLVQNQARVDEGYVYDIRFCVPTEGKEFLWEDCLKDEGGRNSAKEIFSLSLEQLPFLEAVQKRAPEAGEGYVRLNIWTETFMNSTDDFDTATLIFAVPELTMQTAESWAEQMAQSIALPQTQSAES